MTRIRTLLIANRGEIACRIARTAVALGVSPVGVYSDADANAAHVRAMSRSYRIGSGPAAESYLRIDSVLRAAREAGADAVHPGYGFLSENAEFARAVEAAGMIFVGPTPHVLERFGDKAEAKDAAVAAGVAVVPGSEGALSDVDKIAARVRAVGFPVLLKAVGGGGGRGQRLVERPETLADDVAAALREARSAFGSDGLIIERFIPHARHVEVQIVGDGAGRVIHLFERDCTLQRRRQKVIEEAPAPSLSEAVVERLTADAVRLCESVAYRSLGTVEFLVTGEEHFFLEVNPRIQVEHPVTEAATGLDVVALQLRIAAGEGIGLDQKDVRVSGHAVEARLYAESPANQFAPSTGRLETLSLPPPTSGRLRVDAGVGAGDAVTSFYDPMIAKLVASGPNRATALMRLGEALDRVTVLGVDTNVDFLRALVRNGDVAGMRVHTRWIDEQLEGLLQQGRASDEPFWTAVAALLHMSANRSAGSSDPWRNRETFTGWRLGLGTHRAQGARVSLSDPGGVQRDLRIGGALTDGSHLIWDEADEAPDPVRCALAEVGPNRWRAVCDGRTEFITASLDGDRVRIEAEGSQHVFTVVSRIAFSGSEAAAEKLVTAPLTGTVIKVLVAEGDAVKTGAPVAILESMKLEMPIKATADGRVARVGVSEGAMVDRGQLIVEITS